mgnify:FL=1
MRFQFISFHWETPKSVCTVLGVFVTENRLHHRESRALLVANSAPVPLRPAEYTELVEGL